MSESKWVVVDVKKRLVGCDLVISKFGRFGFGSDFSSTLLSNKYKYVSFVRCVFQDKLYFGFKFHKKYVDDSIKLCHINSRCQNLCCYCKGFLEIILNNSYLNFDKTLGFKLIKDVDDIWYFEF